MNPLPAPRALDQYFLEARSRLLDLAAFLDRVGRGENAEDINADPLPGRSIRRWKCYCPTSPTRRSGFRRSSRWSMTPTGSGPNRDSSFAARERAWLSFFRPRGVSPRRPLAYDGGNLTPGHSDRRLNSHSPRAFRPVLIWEDAMPITLGCPSCGKRFRACDESAGTCQVPRLRRSRAGPDGGGSRSGRSPHRGNSSRCLRAAGGRGGIVGAGSTAANPAVAVPVPSKRVEVKPKPAPKPAPKPKPVVERTPEQVATAPWKKTCAGLLAGCSSGSSGSRFPASSASVRSSTLRCRAFAPGRGLGQHSGICERRCRAERDPDDQGRSVGYRARCAPGCPGRALPHVRPSEPPEQRRETVERAAFSPVAGFSRF